MIQINNLSFAYKGSESNVIKDVSFSFPSSGLFYIVGESGSGKSTFLKLISGFLNNYQGSILFQGKELSSFSQKEKSMLYRDVLSVSMQSDLVTSQDTVEENILLPLAIYQLTEEEKRNRLDAVSKTLSIRDLLKEKCSSLSGGEIKRVSLARAIIKDYAILMLDEPLGPLDRKMRLRFTSLFKELSSSALVIVITHNVSEISKDDNVLTFRDGKLSYRAGKLNPEKKKDIISSPRSHYGFHKIIPSAFKMLLRNKKHALFSSFASSLALISLGLISLISSGISSSLTNYLSQSAERNTMLVQRREKTIENSDYLSLDYPVAVSLSKEYSEDIYGVGTYYNLNYENTFVNENRAYFKSGFTTLTMNSLSLRNFGEFTYYKELGENAKYFSNLSLSYEEIGLGLSLYDMSFLCDFLNLRKDNPTGEVNSYISSQGLQLHLDLQASAFGYALELIFKVKRVIPTVKTKIIHTDPLFEENLIEEQMRFKTVLSPKGPFENPWTVFKSYVLLANPDKKRDFLEKAAASKTFKEVCYRNLKDELTCYYQKDDPLTAGRIQVFQEAEKGIYYSEVYSIIQQYRKYIKTFSLSDSFYYFADQGYTGGFLRPVYVSSKRDLLNQIADFNYEAKFDLHGFQGSTIVFSKGVVMGDLSGTQKNPLIFKPYLSYPNLLRGEIPSDFSEVLISSSLAQALFEDGWERKCLNQPLCLSCLTQTEFLDGGFKNIFKDGEVKITGIVEDDTNAIYQNPRFLTALEEDQFDLPLETGVINKVLIAFKSEYLLDGVLNQLTEDYPEYKFSLPVLKMSQTIDDLIGYIEKGLAAFSFFSALIASVLLCLVIFLFVNDGSNRIEMMGALGFFTREIIDYYWGVSFLICLAAYLSSSISLFIFSIFFGKSLEAELGVVFTPFAPEMFVINFVAALLLTLLAGALASIKIALEFKRHNN
ncbi:MAG: ATP-binding cassette domain-containing protein [Bacilli bacterium]|nr:ATP-binding cassette domain-containing protein [Bacilli bacterium]